MRNGDLLVIFIILTIFVAWIALRFRQWLENPSKKFRIPSDTVIPDDETVELLEGAGFDVLAGKTKIPITMTINDQVPPYQSRLYVDYFVQKNEQLFLVKVSRDRKPLEMTGSSIRDMLLSYHLLYPEAAGVLYVDMNQQKIKKITFHIEV